MDDRRSKTKSIGQGIVDAIPIKTLKIDEDTHLSIKVSQLLRIIAIVALSASVFYSFMGRVDNLEETDVSLKNEITVRDSLMRKDFRVDVEAIKVALINTTAELVIARETGLRETNTALGSVNASLVAEIEANRATLQLERQNLLNLIMAANKTTHAELRPLIDNLQDKLDIQTEAMIRRIGSIEDRLQDEVKRTLWGKKK